MAARKKVEIDRERGTPVGPISILIWQLAQQRGHPTPASLMKTVAAQVGVESDSGNWSKYWTGLRPWPPKTWLLWLADYFDVTVEYLQGVRPPIPLVAKISAAEFSYPQHSPPTEQIGNVLNFKWEGERLKRIYALQVEDRSMLPALNEGTILYAQKETNLGEFQDFDLVVYCDSQLRGQIRILTLGPEFCTLSSPNPAIKPLVLPLNHLGACDLIVLSLRRQFI